MPHPSTARRPAGNLEKRAGEADVWEATALPDSRLKECP